VAGRAYIEIAGRVTGAVVGAVLECSQWEYALDCAGLKRLAMTSEIGGSPELPGEQLVRWMPSARFASWTPEAVGTAEPRAKKAMVAMMVRNNILQG
jgi:hypothetical protein